MSHHPGSTTSSSSSTAGSGWFFITHRDQERPNSELRVAPVSNPGKFQVSKGPGRQRGEGEGGRTEGGKEWWRTGRRGGEVEVVGKGGEGVK